MRLIGLAVVLTVSLILAPLAAEAQTAGKKARIGVLMLPPRAGAGGTYIQALREGLHELGYVEGRNLLLEIRWAEGRPDLLPGLAAELLSTRPDVLVKKGDSFHNPAKGVHNAKNGSKTEPAKVLVVLIGEKGAPLSTPVK